MLFSFSGAEHPWAATIKWDWLGNVPVETIRTDPTRMTPGIMTGIGFLGAGTIAISNTG